MPEIASFVASGRPLRRFRVSLPGGGKPQTVAVEDRKPFTKKIIRHVEHVKELADGRKRIEFVRESMDHQYDVKSEMICDAIRAYNDFDPKNPAKSIKQLEIEDLGPVPSEVVVDPVQTQTPVLPRSMRPKSMEPAKSEQEAVKS
jgi:hypothetical protein